MTALSPGVAVRLLLCIQAFSCSRCHWKVIGRNTDDFGIGCSSQAVLAYMGRLVMVLTWEGGDQHCSKQ